MLSPVAVFDLLVTVATHHPMRLVTLLALVLVAPVLSRAGEVVVYNQVFTGSTLNGLKLSESGKGYVLVDLENKLVTRISTGRLPLSGIKVYFAESFSSPLISEPGSGIRSTTMVIHGTEVSTSSGTTEMTIFFQGKESLVAIGPSQKVNVPKLISGTFRWTYAGISSDRVTEDNFSGAFNSSITNDTNGNSRTLDAEVALLTGSLEAAGYMKWSR